MAVERFPNSLSGHERRDGMDATIKDFGEIGLGYGAITATSVSDDEALQHAEAMNNYYETVDWKAPGGCIDGRFCSHTLNNTEAKLGVKLAGGVHISVYAAQEIDNYFEGAGTPLHRWYRSADMLEKQGVPLRIHVDSVNADYVLRTFEEWQERASTLDSDAFIAELNNSEFENNNGGCGMMTALAGAVKNRSDRPVEFKATDGSVQTETPEQVATRLELIRNNTRALRGDAFDEATFNQHTLQASVAAEELEKNWSGIKACLVSMKMLLDNGHSMEEVRERIDVVMDDGKGAHGHIEKDVTANTVENTTLNSAKYTAETGRQTFPPDVWVADPVAKVVATGLDANAQQIRLAQGIVDMQTAGYIGLGDGTQRLKVRLAA